MTYTVNEWGSHPYQDNDDCWCGSDHATLADARQELERRLKAPASGDATAYVVIEGPDVFEAHPVPTYHTPEARRRREREAQDEAWRRELAMEAGMGLGVDAFNDAMGW